MKNDEKISLTIALKKKQYQKLQAIAEIEEKTIEEIVCRFVDQNTKTDRPGCPYSHVPNKKTIRAIKNVKNKKNLVKAETLDDLFKKLGI